MSGAYTTGLICRSHLSRLKQRIDVILQQEPIEIEVSGSIFTQDIIYIIKTGKCPENVSKLAEMYPKNVSVDLNFFRPIFPDSKFRGQRTGPGKTSFLVL